MKYTEKDITLLTDREHIRIRPAMYIGNMAKTEYNCPFFLNDTLTVSPCTFTPGVLKCVGEILDNCIDEHLQNDIFTQITLDTNPITKTYTISDNGRGVPIGKHESGKYTPEVVFGSLRSGRNFTDDKTAGVIGMNGIGSSAVCALSSEFSVEIQRDNKLYKQTFINGGETIQKPYIRKSSKKQTGTKVSFMLDDTLFGDTTIPPNILENKLIEVALTNPGVTTKYNGKRYKYNGGFNDLIKKISKQYFKFQTDQLEFYVIFDVSKSESGEIFTWVNSSLLYDGGLCNTQFINGFIASTTNHLKKSATKAKSEITQRDIKENLLIIANLKISDPQYDAQSKTRLTGPCIRKDISAMLNDQWGAFTRKNKNWLDTVLERAIIRHHVNSNTKAIKDHQKSSKRKVPGLIDATSKHRLECQLLLTEGDSAASSIADARDSKTTASLPLRGKVNNTYGISVAQLLKMQKVSDMITAIGLTPGKKPIRSVLNYGKVIIATDADYDGNDIFSLLINVLYQFWPLLFDPNYEPFIYRLVAPNICATKGSKRVHFTTPDDFNKSKDKYEKWDINYYKGLGSMVKEDWKIILSGKDDTLIPIVDDGNIADTLNLLFSSNSDKRKIWLQNV